MPQRGTKRLFTRNGKQAIQLPTDQWFCHRCENPALENRYPQNIIKA
jgi:hypothetical protein